MPDASPHDVTAASAPPPAVPDTLPPGRNRRISGATCRTDASPGRSRRIGAPPGGAAVALSWARFANERSAAYARAVEAGRPAAAEAEDVVDTSDAF